jgi:hypothetical protein
MLTNYMTLISRASSYSVLFCQIDADLNSILKTGDWASSYSVKFGGYTAARRAGVSAEARKKHGGWKLLSY